MTDLRQYLSAREQDISSQIEALKIELREIELAKNAIFKPDVNLGSVVNSVSSNPNLSIKSMIIKLLQKSENGLPSKTILEKINSEFNVNITRTTLSPQLSRLRHDGKIRNEEGIYFLEK